MTIPRRGLAGLLSATALAAPRITRAAEGDLVRFAWTNTVSVSAQVQHTLMRTNIAEKHGLRIQMIQMASSPPVNEALLGNAADMGSVSDFSAVTMMAARAPVLTVSHQSSFRSAILATRRSGITKTEDLRGKNVFGVFGITAFQNAQDAVRRAGLTPGRDMNFVNMGTPELADAVRAQRIDAFFTWDPWVSFFVQQGFATILSENPTPAMVLEARKAFVDTKPDVLKRFLRAHAEAMFFASKNHELTNGWFRSLDPARGLPVDVIETASNIDPHWNAPSIGAIKQALTPERLAIMQGLAKWGAENRLLQSEPRVTDYANTAIAQAVDEENAARQFDASGVTVTG